MASAVDSSHYFPRSGSFEGRSNHSSSTDMSRFDHGSDSGDLSRTHHLLKHCLSNGQRGEALAHFGTDDVKEAAKEISKMGQRDLQSKFRLVYGTATHSNNNDWLRRKLYEAIGAAPIKAATKSKPRKASSKSKKTAAHAAVHPPHDPPFHVGSAPTASELAERRSRRFGTKLAPKGASVADNLKRYRYGTTSMPGSPVVGRSVLDMHRYLGHDSTTTSASEDDSETFDEEDNVGERAAVRRRHSSDEPSGYVPRPGSAFAAASRVPLPAVPPHMRTNQQQQAPLMHSAAQALLGRRTSSAAGFTLAGQASINMDMFQSASDVWGTDAWADAALKAAAARRAPAAWPSVEDEDILMLPMDLSFQEEAAALL